MANPNGKDTIYIDIDDEITSIIDKVRDSDDRIVALVLPKRASVLHSIVNMKLLKRTADDAKKNLVLITSETGLLPLAGAVGIHVARTLTSRPEIPAVPTYGDAPAAPEFSEVETSDDDGVTNASAGDKPVGELAAAGTGFAAGAAADEGIETLELDDQDEANGEPEAAAGVAGAAAVAAAKKPKKDKKLLVPNFNRFRLGLVLAALLVVLLIGGWVVAYKVLPKATVTISTDTSEIPSSLTLNLDTNAKTLDTNTQTVPAQVQQVQKNQTQQVAATGKQNNGTKATGTVSMSAGSCSGDVPGSINQGVSLTSNNMTYILGDDVNFVPTVSKGKCTFQGVDSNGHNNIAVSAQQPGSNYNTSGSFTVYGRSDVSASGSTSGGTDNIVQIVTQSDIDSATQKLGQQDTGSVKQQLQQQLQQAGLFAVISTFAASTPNVTSSSKAGDQASTVTVSSNVTYTMFGVKQADLKTLVDADVKDKIDPSKQTILSEGLDTANFRVISNGATAAQVGMTTTATAGPDLKAADIQKQVAGKKSGDIQNMLKNDPGVTAVSVKLSPFWVTSAPSNPSKTTVIFQKSAR